MVFRRINPTHPKPVNPDAAKGERQNAEQQIKHRQEQQSPQRENVSMREKLERHGQAQKRRTQQGQRDFVPYRKIEHVVDKTKHPRQYHHEPYDSLKTTCKISRQIVWKRCWIYRKVDQCGAMDEYHESYQVGEG